MGFGEVFDLFTVRSLVRVTTTEENTLLVTLCRVLNVGLRKTVVAVAIASTSILAVLRQAPLEQVYLSQSGVTKEQYFDLPDHCSGPGMYELEVLLRPSNNNCRERLLDFQRHVPLRTQAELAWTHSAERDVGTS